MKRQSIPSLFLLGALLAIAPQAEASESYGQIVHLWVRDSDGLIYVTLDRAPTTPRPACAASTSYYMIARENSEVGKRQYAMLLAAKLAGKPVYIWGKGACVRWGDGEDIEGLRLSD